MTAGGIRIDTAYLTAKWLESMLYGMNFVLFFSYLFIARYKRLRTPTINKFLLSAAIIMFCLSTAHISLNFRRMIVAFIYLRDQGTAPEAYFTDITNPLAIGKSMIHTVNTVIGDSILGWRCYHVWSKDWRICILPVLLIIGSAVSGFSQCILRLVQAKTIIRNPFANQLKSWNGAIFGISLATNVIVTLLIAFRIWYISKQINSHVDNPSLKYRRVLLLVVESGAIYSSALVILITLYLLNSNGTYIIYDSLAQLMTIVPTMIIIMSSLGLTAEELNASQTTTTTSTFRIEAITTTSDSMVISGADSSNAATVTGENKPSFHDYPSHSSIA